MTELTFDREQVGVQVQTIETPLSDRLLIESTGMARFYCYPCDIEEHGAQDEMVERYEAHVLGGHAQ